MALQGIHLVFIQLGLLELKTFCGLGHQGLVVAYDFIYAPAEQTGDFIDVGIVLLTGNSTYAAALATAYVQVEAGTELVPEHGIGGDVVLAAAQGISVPEELQQRLGVHHRAVGAEIARAVAHEAAGKEHLRELVRRDADPGIGLGVLEEYVVSGLVLLYEVVLEQEGIGLAVYDRILQVSDLRHQDAGLDIEPLGRNEVLGHTLVEVLCLTHIYHISLGVIIPVDPGGMWQ